MAEDSLRRRKIVEEPSSHKGFPLREHATPKKVEESSSSQKGIILRENYAMPKISEDTISEIKKAPERDSYEMTEEKKIDITERLMEAVLGEENTYKTYIKNILHVDSRNIVPIYNYTKYLEFFHLNEIRDDINNNDLDDDPKSLEEKVENIKNKFTMKKRTGYKLNLNGSKLLVIDFDNDSITEPLYSQETFTDEIMTEKTMEYYSFPIIGKLKKKLKSSDIHLNFFATLFRTLFVMSPNHGYHFYFENDLTENDLIDIFGSPAERYCRVNDPLNLDIPVDVFVDINKDTYITLPTTTISQPVGKIFPYKEEKYEKVKTNKEFEYKTYSNFLSVDNTPVIRRASDYIDLFKRMFKRDPFRNYSQENKERNKSQEDKNTMYERRALAYKSDTDFVKATEFFKKFYDILNEKETIIHHYTGYSIYHILNSIVYQPDEAQQTLLELLISTLGNKFSERTWYTLKSQYTRLYDEKVKKTGLKSIKLVIDDVKKMYGIEMEEPKCLLIYNNERSFNYFNIKKEDLPVVEFNKDEMFKELKAKYPKLRI